MRRSALLALAAVVGCREPAVFHLDGRGWSTPAADADRAYYAGRDHEVVAVDRWTGALAWRARTGGEGPATAGANLVLAGGVVAAGDDDIHAFDRASGARRWRFHPEDGALPGRFNLATDGETIYAGSPAGRAHAVDAQTGAPRWTAVLATDGVTSVFDPVVDGGQVLVGVVHFTRPPRGGLASLDAATGALRWSRDFDGEQGGCNGGAVVVHGLVVAAARDGRIHALDRATGAIRWTAPALSARADRRPLAVCGGFIVAGSSTGFLVALDPASGREAWRATASRGSLVQPLGSDGRRVYAVHFGGQLAVFDCAGGGVLRREGELGDGGEFLGAAALSPGAVYLSGRHGYFALRP